MTTLGFGAWIVRPTGIAGVLAGLGNISSSLSKAV
jgi:hypothetical protein